MQKMRKILAVFLLAAVTALSFVSCDGNESIADDPGKIQLETAAFLAQQVPEPSMNSVGGEWSVMALRKSSYELEDAYYQDYYDRLCEKTVETKGKLSESRYTDYARVCLALCAIEKDATDVEGYDLMRPADEVAFVTQQGINGPVYALIAANVCGYELKSEQRYLTYILDSELEQGGFVLDGTMQDADVDITAMVLQALSFYQQDAEVKQTIDRSVDKLAELLQQQGGDTSAESVAQTMLALTSLGIDPLSDERFTIADQNLGDALMTFRTEEHGFSHEAGEETNLMATEQALCALDALVLYQEGKTFYER